MRMPHCKVPCANCPFRKDSLQGWLPNSIEVILKQDSFVCHKKKTDQCAGHMLLKGQGNSYVRLATAMQEDLGLSGRELIFDTIEQCITHHKTESKEVVCVNNFV